MDLAETLGELLGPDPDAGSYRRVLANSLLSSHGTTDWWGSLTDGGGEGMGIKPLESIIHATGGLVLSSVKHRGR